MTIVKTSTRKQLTIIGHQEKKQNQNKQKTPKQIKEKKTTHKTNKQTKTSNFRKVVNCFLRLNPRILSKTRHL